MNNFKMYGGVAILIGVGIGTVIQYIHLGKIKKDLKANKSELHDLEIRLDEDRKIAKILGIDDSKLFEEEGS